MFVAGCHRSGTSYVSGLLSAVLRCERPADLDITVDNPRGYFESTLLRPFNDDLLANAGYAWDRPPLAPVFWQQGKYLLEAIKRKEEFSAYALSTSWIDKDPRLSLTFPLFEHLLLKRVPCLVPLRHPLDVAASLRLRDGFSLDKGLFIWYLYNRGCACFLRDDLDQIVSYERLLAGDQVQLERLVAFLLPWAREQGLANSLGRRIDAAHADTSHPGLRRNALEQRESSLPSASCQLLQDHCLTVYKKVVESGFKIEVFARLFRDCPAWLVDFYERTMAEGTPSLEYLRLHDVRRHDTVDVALSAKLQTGQYERDKRIIEDFGSLLEAIHALQEEMRSGIEKTNQLDAPWRRVAELERELQALQASTSWRLTAPLRHLKGRLRL